MKNTDLLGRRSFVRGAALALAASATATASIANAVPALAAYPSDDVTLIALAAEITRLYAEKAPLSAEAARVYAIYEAEADRLRLTYSDADVKTRIRMEAEMGVSATVDAVDDYFDRIGAIEEKALSLRPVTAAGLAAKAIIVRSAVRYVDNVPRADQDWDELLFNSLMDDLAALARLGEGD